MSVQLHTKFLQEMYLNSSACLKNPLWHLISIWTVIKHKRWIITIPFNLS